MPQINSNQFPDVYAELGVAIPALGCVMADVAPFPVTSLVGDGAEDDLYYSQVPERFWIQGAVAERSAHVTLLYGLMQPGPVWGDLIAQVLDGWTPPDIQIEAVSFFLNPYAQVNPDDPDSDYTCIVGLVSVTPQLLEGHQRLQLLPHIDTFAGYKPHVTLAYVKNSARTKWVNALQGALTGKTLPVTDINLGGDH